MPNFDVLTLLAFLPVLMLAMPSNHTINAAAAATKRSRAESIPLQCRPHLREIYNPQAGKHRGMCIDAMQCDGQL